MSYTPPITWAVNGVVLNATDVKANEEAMKKYVNQDILPSDILAGSLDYDNFQRGEYDPISTNHQFTCGDVLGKNVLVNTRNRMYFTAETKGGTQTAGLQYQSVYESSETVQIEGDAKVLITFSCESQCENNSITSGGPGLGSWDSEITLKHTNDLGIVAIIDTARSWTFEEKGGSLGAHDPVSSGLASRRQIGWSKMISVAPGKHKFEVVVNPKVEQGFISARNLLIEVFYV